MKEEWKPEELRATSEEIRGSVMPKSVTPEMVGGTLLGVVNALGEVVEVLGEIPREHVRVKVRGYDGAEGVSGAGATVWLDVFNSKGYPAVSIPRRKLTADDDGVVEFDVPHGFKYAVFSQIEGLGASFQLVETAASDNRTLYLWNLPTGIYFLYYSSITSDIEDNYGYRYVPVIRGHYEVDYEDEYYNAIGWDINADNEEYSDENGFRGIVVSTVDTSFVIRENSLSEDVMRWSENRDYATLIPALPSINDYDENGEPIEGLWEATKNRARADMDGNMNTAKILDFCHKPLAADYCASLENCDWDEQAYLPSGGQIYTMWLNRKVINALMIEANGEGCGFQLLPYQDDKGNWVWPNGHAEYWWTSTVDSKSCSWFVRYDGYIYNHTSYNTNDVRAVSAFHFEY